jgi:hypothetical protein
VIEATEWQSGRLRVMVANAGIGIMCQAVEMTVADLAAPNRSEPRRRIAIGEVRRSVMRRDARARSS